MAIFSSKLTRKHVQIYNYNVGLSLYASNKKSVTNSTLYSKKSGRLVNSAKYQRFDYSNLFKLNLLGKRVLKSIYWFKSEKFFSRFYKKVFKKSKQRLYSQNFILLLERSLFSILYQSRIIKKIRNIKHLAITNKIFVNGLINRGYNKIINPNDFVQLSFFFYDDITSHKLESTVSIFNFFSSKIIGKVFRDFSIVFFEFKKIFYSKIYKRFVSSNVSAMSAYFLTSSIFLENAYLVSYFSVQTIFLKFFLYFQFFFTALISFDFSPSCAHRYDLFMQKALPKNKNLFLFASAFLIMLE